MIILEVNKKGPHQGDPTFSRESVSEQLTLDPFLRTLVGLCPDINYSLFVILQYLRLTRCIYVDIVDLILINIKEYPPVDKIVLLLPFICSLKASLFYSCRSRPAQQIDPWNPEQFQKYRRPICRCYWGREQTMQMLMCPTVCVLNIRWLSMYLHGMLPLCASPSQQVSSG